MTRDMCLVFVGFAGTAPSTVEKSISLLGSTLNGELKEARDECYAYGGCTFASPVREATIRSRTRDSVFSRLVRAEARIQAVMDRIAERWRSLGLTWRECRCGGTVALTAARRHLRYPRYRLHLALSARAGRAYRWLTESVTHTGLRRDIRYVPQSRNLASAGALA